MSSIRKSIRRESRWRMASSCRAPSEVFVTGAAGAAFGADVEAAAEDRRERFRSANNSAESSRWNNRLKKARNARKMRFKLGTPKCVLGRVARPAVDKPDEGVELFGGF